jgi:hypothetical protein
MATFWREELKSRQRIGTLILSNVAQEGHSRGTATLLKISVPIPVEYSTGKGLSKNILDTWPFFKPSMAILQTLFVGRSADEFYVAHG